MESELFLAKIAIPFCLLALLICHCYFKLIPILLMLAHTTVDDDPKETNFLFFAEKKK